jgi:hypothetical protein
LIVNCNKSIENVGKGPGKKEEREKGRKIDTKERTKLWQNREKEKER